MGLRLEVEPFQVGYFTNGCRWVANVDIELMPTAARACWRRKLNCAWGSTMEDMAGTKRGC